MGFIIYLSFQVTKTLWWHFTQGLQNLGTDSKRGQVRVGKTLHKCTSVTIHAGCLHRQFAGKIFFCTLEIYLIFVMVQDTNSATYIYTVGLSADLVFIIDHFWYSNTLIWNKSTMLRMFRLSLLMCLFLAKNIIKEEIHHLRTL